MSGDHTQGQHDAAFNNAPEPSAAVARQAREAIETRALGEILLLTEGFTEWLAEQPATDLAKMLSLSFQPTSQAFRVARDKFADKYFEYRQSCAEATGEWAKEIRDAMA